MPAKRGVQEVLVFKLSRVLFVAFIVCLQCASIAGAPQAEAVTPPVSGSVVDPYRPPVNRYGAGNRGVDFATSPDSDVRAALGGVVSFAGSVAGTLYVVVSHGRNLRTTYGGLAETTVRQGDVVNEGDVVGAAGNRLHFGLRRNDDYLNPALLFGRARLVPVPPRVER